jgi:hypothetical protein
MTLKKLAITLTGAALAFGTTQLGAIDQSTKIRLMEEAIVESAATPGQKSAVAAYMQTVAKEKLELAQNLRERANSPRAGKVAYRNAEKRDLIKKAERLEKEAEQYKKF